MAAGSIGYMLGYSLALAALGYVGVYFLNYVRADVSDSTDKTDDLDACPNCDLELAPMLTECPRCETDVTGES